MSEGNTKQKHTPGPWKYDGQMFIFGPKSEMVAQIRGYGAGLPQEANANLIAAAPDLLEVLVEIVNLWNGPKEKAALSYVQLEKAKTVIAKAEGR